MNGCAPAAPPPVTLSAEVSGSGSIDALQGCVVAITQVIDARTDPVHLGVYAGKAIKAPDDREAWLRNIVEGLRRHGVQPTVADNPAPHESKQGYRIVLEKAWVSNTHDDIAASVLLRLDGPGDGTGSAPARFRGTKQKTTYFSSGNSKLQAGLDAAIDEALSGMASHLRKTCGA
jgi:hypothetical protein